MRSLFLSILTIIFFNNSSNAQSITQLKACDVLSIEQMAKLLETNPTNLVKEDMSFAEGKRRTICHYILKGAIGSVNVRVATKSDKAKENKVLEKSYQRYLTQGEQNISSYEEISAEGEIQILYGANTDRSGTNHVIRKRFGNIGEIKIEVLKGNSDESLRTALLEIIQGY